ncbi:hypothetical protein BD410DRAFT_779992 [Rickenella mellea]|uniref:DUF7704 domain-containing protein n=1 Tax=Rickenella mellea TaxID=50990 RepID=A0A4R5XFK1_9AGAM|nr:hypothetical protein BD410DRAFT_779992 [Rickenella mellea]
MAPTSAIPPFYYLTFGVYEPIVTVVGFFGAMSDPKKTHDSQAPWPMDKPPSDPLPQATLVTIVQLAHVCGLLGILNLFILYAARKYLSTQPANQEKIVGALLTPLVFADVFHLAITFWALGDNRWNFRKWSSLLWSTWILGLTLLIPRIAWHLGIGRYVDRRDGRTRKSL